MLGDESEPFSRCPSRDLVGEVSGARESFGVGSNASGGLFALFRLANSALNSPTEGVESGNVDSMAMWAVACHIRASMQAKGSGGHGYRCDLRVVSQMCVRSRSARPRDFSGKIHP